MPETFTVNKSAKFFVVICKSTRSVHSYQFLGVEIDNTKQILGGFGKIISLPSRQPGKIEDTQGNCSDFMNQLAAYCGLYFSEIEGQIQNEWHAGKTIEKDISYKAYSISYAHYLDYLLYMKKISRKQQNEHKFKPLMAYSPQNSADTDTSTVKLEWKAIDLIPDSMSPNPPSDKDICNHTRIGITNTCRTSAIGLTKRATGMFEGLGRGVSSFFGFSLPLNMTTSSGIMGGHKFCIREKLPQNQQAYRYRYILVGDKLHFVNHSYLLENIKINDMELFSQNLAQIRKKQLKRKTQFGLYVAAEIPENLNKFVNGYIFLQEKEELFFVTKKGVLKKQDAFKDCRALTDGLKKLQENTGMPMQKYFSLDSRQLKQWITFKGASDLPELAPLIDLHLSSQDHHILITGNTNHRPAGADERHIFILPLPPKSFIDISEKKQAIITRLYDRLDQIILDQQYSQITIDKFEKIKALYESITVNEKSNLKEIFKEIEGWVSENFQLVKTHRNSHWFSFQTATEKLFTNLLTEGRKHSPF